MPKPRVLLIDEDPQVLDVARRSLLSQNFVVLMATDVVRALTLALVKQPDAIVLDTAMQGGAGKIPGRENQRLLWSPLLSAIILFLHPRRRPLNRRQSDSSWGKGSLPQLFLMQ